MACPPRDAFQIGWFCSLPIEAAAAAEMLDERFGNFEEQDAADTNTYTLGRIGEHNIAIASPPRGNVNHSVNSIIVNMVRTFCSLRIGLMVGIGSGLPSATHDIRLGDIVIGSPEGPYGGVIQYDMGKVTTDGLFERTELLNSPPKALLDAVNQLTANTLSGHSLYQAYLQRAIGRNARTRENFVPHDAQSDRLFQTKHNHPMEARTCDDCPAEWEEFRSERYDSDPQFHYGIIASGNMIIKNGKARDQLAETTGALCYETATAGLMEDFPCLVIRGICDYADSHGYKSWAGYAALAAASYTKELLGCVPISRVSQEGLAVDMCGKGCSISFRIFKSPVS
ncbi:hypothetical protein N7470_004688 [Penicillium chermesinum]|nr:hypothetical protein N7470_004688 [Penicillium chermesinum]